MSSGEALVPRLSIRFISIAGLRALYAAVLFASLLSVRSLAQTVAPPVVEYQQKADGQLVLTNNSLTTYVVVLEPKSFSINREGRDIFRPLDPSVHLKLSSTSFKLLPKQSYTVFYSVNSDTLPAWFTIYSTFSQPQRGPGVNLRIMLPHTVYLYQKTPLAKSAVKLTEALYDPDKKLVSFDVENVSSAYGRVRSSEARAGHETVAMSGFPLLPNSPRHVEATWTGKVPPEQVHLHFDNFDLTQPVVLQTPSTPASAQPSPSPQQ
jgi:hypothetical protein